jgi:glycosyltransferase involved in cell wall biosynthesis
MDADGAVITSLDEQIPRKLGGPTLDDYGRVDFSFATRSRCTRARIRLSIDEYLSNKDGAKGEAFLFFTHLSFALDGEGDVGGPFCALSADQVVALTRGAAVLDVTLPRVAAAIAGLAPTVEVIDTRTNMAAGGSPIRLPAAAELRFRSAGFDGVTLAGDVAGATGGEILELLIDDMVAGRQVLATTADGGTQQVKLRVKDALLNGCPHIVELREVGTGRTLFLSAEIVKSFVTPWEQLVDFSRSPLPFELHPNARRRYRSLAEHMQSLAAAQAADDGRRRAQTVHHAGQAYAVLMSLEAGQDPHVKLDVPAEKAPEVSIILCAPDCEAAYRSVAALGFAYNTTRSEIIVVVEGDAAGAARLRERVSGIGIVEAASDGRAQACNKAAARAHGRYLALVNAPAEPAAFWLDELRLIFDLFDGVGLAGGKLVKANGRLQEAGGIVWASGNRQPVGANGNAEHPQANYVRQVDYVAAAATMIARDTWEAVGGLSEDFHDPQLATIDLAFKVRAGGRKVVYAPHAAVVAGQRDAGARPTTAPQEGGRAAFKRKWADVYRTNPPEKRSVREAMDGGISGRILFIDQQVPRADVDAGSYAAIQEARLFQALGYKVALLPMNLTHLGVYTRALQRIGIEVLHAPFANSVEDVIKERGNEFDLVYITRFQVARAVLPFVRRHNPRAKVIFNNADLHFLRELRTALAQKDAEMLRRSRMTRDQELEAMRQVDLTISYNEVEHAVIQSHNLDQTRLAKAPWVVSAATAVAPFAERKNVAFVGSFGHRPNLDAVRYFVSDVMPRLRRSLPGVAFDIYGSQIGADVQALASADVLVKGHVDSLAEVYGTTRVFVAPLVAGAGLKGKVLAAMSYGVPSVLSPAAAEGIGGQAGVQYLAAQSPQDWVDAIAALYEDEKAWKKVSANALEFVRAHYSFERGLETLRRALETIDVYPPRQPRALWCREPLPPLL